MKNLTILFAIVAIAIGMSVTLAAPAFASVTGTVITPSGESLYVRNGPGVNYNKIGSLSRGTVVSFSCYANGTAVTGPYGTETAWDRLDSGGYVSDAWIYTGSNNAVVPQCGPSVGCNAKSCVGKSPGDEGCMADATVVTQVNGTPDIDIWEPDSRVTAVVWEYHSNACDAAWYEVAGPVWDDYGDLADMSAWNPHGPSQHFTYSVGSGGKINATASAMVDDENGVYACVGAQIYYLKSVTVNGQVKLVKTYFQWEVMRCH
jgi:uncharacterized protein YraI